MKNLIIASTSTLHGGEYLEYLLPVLKNHFAKCHTIVFIPFAQPGGMSYDEYTARVATAFSKIDKKVVGLHSFDSAKDAIEKAEAIFVGGGNTFLLVSKLYENNVMEVLSKSIENGTPYLGSSAGSNITGLTMQTTNDMPIVYPPSFKTLGAISFNLNPHFLDVDLKSKHMGETRETRIKEFHAFNSIPVLGLREGSWLDVKGAKVILKGNFSARLFKQNQKPEEIATDTDLSFLE